MCRPVGLRVGLKGCGVPGIDLSGALDGRKGSGEYMATGRGVGDGLASRLLNWDPFLWDVYQASSQASSFSLLRCLFFDSSLLQRPSCSLRTGLPGWKGATRPGQAPNGSLGGVSQWLQAWQEVGERLNRTFTSAFIFPISAGQTENLINCMKPK